MTTGPIVECISLSSIRGGGATFESAPHAAGIRRMPSHFEQAVRLVKSDSCGCTWCGCRGRGVEHGLRMPTGPTPKLRGTSGFYSRRSEHLRCRPPAWLNKSTAFARIAFFALIELEGVCNYLVQRPREGCAKPSNQIF